MGRARAASRDPPAPRSIASRRPWPSGTPCSRMARSRPGPRWRRRIGRSVDASGSPTATGSGGCPPRLRARWPEASWPRRRPRTSRSCRAGRAPGSRAPVTPPTPPNGGSPSVRRSSSHVIAGRKGRPSAVGHDDRAALGRERDAGERLPVARPGSARTRRHASPTAVQYTSGSCSAQPGCGETYGVNGTRATATIVPSGAMTSARALCVPTSIATIGSAAHPAGTPASPRGRPGACVRSGSSRSDRRADRSRSRAAPFSASR